MKAKPVLDMIQMVALRARQVALRAAKLREAGYEVRRKRNAKRSGIGDRECARRRKALEE